MRVTKDAGAHTRLTGAGVAHGSASSTWSSSGSNAVSARAMRRVSCCYSSQSASSSRGSRLHSLPTGESRRISQRIHAHHGASRQTRRDVRVVGVRRFGRQATFAGLSLILGTLNCVCSDDSYGSNPGFLRFYAFGIGERRDAEMDRRDESRENSAHPSEMAAAHACRGRAQALVRARSTRSPPLCPPRSLRSRGPIRSPRAHSSSRRWAQARRPSHSNTVDAHLCCSPCVHSQQRVAARGWA